MDLDLWKRDPGIDQQGGNGVFGAVRGAFARWQARFLGIALPQAEELAAGDAEDAGHRTKMQAHFRYRIDWVKSRPTTPVLPTFPIKAHFLCNVLFTLKVALPLFQARTHKETTVS
jgi:hypothetical protein